MRLRVVMADPAGNRTAIVRTPVPVQARADIAAWILKNEDLRAEQVGFETAPLNGGEGRLEMMGGEFCGNAARSYGFLLWSAKALAAAEQRGEELSGSDLSGGAAAKSAQGDLSIEISGTDDLLNVHCEAEAFSAVAGRTVCRGSSFSQMPMPLSLEYTEEGSPLVISEGIAHVILEDTEADDKIVNDMIARYGARFPAFGLQFLTGEQLIPVVSVPAAGSLVYESSCGSGSLAAAWYQAVRSDLQSHDCLFREPGGTIEVRLWRDADGAMKGCMGGDIFLEQEKIIVIDL